MKQLQNQEQTARLSRCSGLALSAVLCLLTCGCGLLHVPYSTTLPREPFSRVSVRAYETREPLRDSIVSIVLYEHHNWIEPMGWCRVTESPDGFRDVVGIKSDDDCETWQAEGIGNGDFEVAPRTKCSWVQVWFPLPSVLGPCIYHTYDAVVVASAPGHKTTWFTDRVALPCTSGPEWGPRESRLPAGTYVEPVEGVLHIYLPRCEDGRNRSDTSIE